MAEIRINATGGVKLYDADDSHYAQIIAGTITANTDVMTLGHAAVVMGTKLDCNGNNLILDADADTYIDGGTADDTLDIYIAGAKDFTLTANTLTAQSGSTIAAQALTATTVTASGIIKTDDTTAATSTTDGSLQTDGGLSVALDGVIGDDLYMLSDASVIHFGANSEVTLTHSHDAGLLLKHTATADDKPINLVLQTGETDMAANDVIGKISFQAPDEGTGTDAILVSGAIQAVAEGNHSSSSNATSLQFMTGASEAATAKMHIKSDGKVGIGEGTPLGTLHVYGGNSTADGVQSNSTALVVEGAANCGLQFLSTNDEFQTINFGDPEDPNIGSIQYYHNDNSLYFRANDLAVAKFDGQDLMLPDATDDGRVQIMGSYANPQIIIYGPATTNTTKMSIRNGNGQVGTIQTDGSATAYNTSSDYRLKENETAITDGITRIKQLKPYRFNFKTNADKTVDGFFAHEVSGIVPEAISGEKDATEKRLKTVKKADGSVIESDIEEDDWTKGKTDGKYPSDSTWTASEDVIEPQGIDQSKLVPLLVAAIIELEARVKTLEDA